MISCIPLSWAAEKYSCPMRFAGTCRQYSKKAMPQLARMTVISGADLNFKCPYHAKVIKTFEAVKSKTGYSACMISSFQNCWNAGGSIAFLRGIHIKNFSNGEKTGILTKAGECEGDKTGTVFALFSMQPDSSFLKECESQ